MKLRILIATGVLILAGCGSSSKVDNGTSSPAATPIDATAANKLPSDLGYDTRSHVVTIAGHLCIVVENRDAEASGWTSGGVGIWCEPSSSSATLPPQP